jgi:hypothetical protein
VNTSRRGRALRGKLRGYAARVIDGATADFAPHELEALRTGLQKLRANLSGERRKRTGRP